jgi:EpsI family protein
MTRRLLTAFALVAATAVVAYGARHTPAPPPVAIEALPLSVGAWQGSATTPLDEETVRVLAADMYINRTYAAPAGPPIGLYAAYYAAQRPGVTIHSPLHCLPGTGWEPTEIGSSGDFRKLVVRKDRQEAVVLYWYAIHGRIVGNELLSKAWLLHDAVRFRRSDAALVRVVVPVEGSVERAERDGFAFATALLPYVSHLWS